MFGGFLGTLAAPFNVITNLVGGSPPEPEPKFETFLEALESKPEEPAPRKRSRPYSILKAQDGGDGLTRLLSSLSLNLNERPNEPPTATQILATQKPNGFAEDKELLPHQHAARTRILKLLDSELKGCILADMGLGKTVEIIAAILDIISLLPKDQALRFLIVVPASLLPQWVTELKAFAPALRVFIHHGTKKATSPAEFASADLVLTTYGTLANEFVVHTAPKATMAVPSAPSIFIRFSSEATDDDATPEPQSKSAPLFEYGLWGCVALDEGHTIKNSTTLNARACFALDAKYRIIATATPFQNGAKDGWSYLQFLRMAPYYENYAYFKANIKRLPGVWQKIMIRRTKGQLAKTGQLKSLPEKTVTDVRCDMEPWQRQKYDEIHTAVNLSAPKPGASKKTKPCEFVRVLRKMQATDHTAIVPDVVFSTNEEALDVKCQTCGAKLDPDDWEDATPPTLCDSCSENSLQKPVKNQPRFTMDQVLPMSSKIDQLLKILAIILKGNDKVIIFSRFTSFLAIIRLFLEENGMPLVEYTGGMSMKDREESLFKFKSDPKITIALMSLRAGGVGLNLNVANHVILTEPWWNPAVEDQAIDRVHRIGQTKPVHVYRLLAPDTIDFDVRDIQAAKRLIAEEMMSGRKTEGSLSKLSAKESSLLIAGQ